MDFTVSIASEPGLTALQKALASYNASVPQQVSQGEFIQKLVDGQVAGLVAAYLKTKLAPFDFLNRFTAAERAAIRTAAQTSGQIADYIAMIEAAPAVVLTDELTTSGVQYLEAQGLIAAGRAAEILAL